MYDYNKAVSLDQQGTSMKGVAEVMGVSVATVRLLLWSNDIEIRKKGST